MLAENKRGLRLKFDRDRGGKKEGFCEEAANDLSEKKEKEKENFRRGRRSQRFGRKTEGSHSTDLSENHPERKNSRH